MSENRKLTRVEAWWKYRASKPLKVAAGCACLAALVVLALWVVETALRAEDRRMALETERNAELMARMEQVLAGE